MPKAVIIGSGLGGLATALRLTHHGYQVEVIEKAATPGGRLNILKQDGFTFDTGPSFFSMSYAFTELFSYCKIKNPLQLNELNPLYTVYFEGRDTPLKIYKDLDVLQKEFANIEPELKLKLEKYLKKAGQLFHDTEHIVIDKNFDSTIGYLYALSRVPWKHAPMMFRSMWEELEKTFTSQEAKVIFSLVAFFLGNTPFQTPAVYSLLNYTEMIHDGYWNVKGGMYSITSELVKLLEARGVVFQYNTEIAAVNSEQGKIKSVVSSNGTSFAADVFVCNSDAASFRGKVLNRKKFSEKKLDNMEWTLAPFTIYLGVKGKVDKLQHHNYFLGDNFKQYADTIFKTTVAPDKPYYYVNVSSKSNPNCAPDGCENIFILCPVPDLRTKPEWSDSQQLADTIIADISKRVNFDLHAATLTKTIWTPIDWQEKFSLYRGSGLGLAHGLNQVGGLRPRNYDELLKNLFYVGASTTPGTGLPMVTIGSKLVMERILKM
ncbi:MAG: phytoene desaturase [Bacteroidetes bacterium]|nr:phytoene desaturase [Bacteroidota bacterium]